MNKKLDFPEGGDGFRIRYLCWLICNEECSGYCDAEDGSVGCNVIQAKDELERLINKIKALEKEIIE